MIMYVRFKQNAIFHSLKPKQKWPTFVLFRQNNNLNMHHAFCTLCKHINEILKFQNFSAAQTLHCISPHVKALKHCKALRHNNAPEAQFSSKN